MAGWGPLDRLRGRGLALPRSLALAFVLIGAAALRYAVWAADFPLHHDEALYGYWARLIISGRDPFLLTAWVDKPPLVLYLLAGALHGFGVSERVLRLPGMIASLATIICTWGLARRLYDDRTALVSAGLLAVSPFAILFAPTAFTDPWLTLWSVVAVWAAVAGRSFWAGVAVGLAVASKQQGVLIAPPVAWLVLAGAEFASRRPELRRGSRLAAAGRRGLAALFGFALIFAPVTWWDTLRWAKRPSFWDRSLTTYGGLGWAPPALWPERAADWAQILGYWFGLPALTALLCGLALFAVLRERRVQRVGVALAAFGAGYLALHLIITFQPWDRYLLPLLPFACLLAGRG
ncbi:MAG: ArnT family glycosyltransferase, partial [Anaerolineae bacterium]